MTPIFVRPRHEYQTYIDLHRIIEQSGYPLIYVDDLDPKSDNTYIVTMLNGEWLNGWPDAKARIVFWDLEWHTDWIRSVKPVIPGVAEIWASDLWYAEKIEAKYVLLGSHPNLCLRPEDLDQPYDFYGSHYDAMMLAYLTPRRQVIHNQLTGQGMKVAPNGLGEDRHRSLCRSRLMLHVHQHDDVQTIAPLRFALAAAYKLPLISEDVHDEGVYGDSVLFRHYDKLAQTAAWYNQVDDMPPYGQWLYDLLCVEHTFKKEVEDAL